MVMKLDSALLSLTTDLREIKVVIPFLNGFNSFIIKFYGIYV